MSADDAAAHGEEEEHHTRGTFFLMLCFLGVIAAMWIWMYVTLLMQG